MLEIKKISKGYGQPGTSGYRQVLDQFDLSVGVGERVAIMGPSGSGKTTVLNIIGTLDRPDSGTILYNGRDLNGYPAIELARFRNMELGFVFQLHHLLPQLTLIENVLLPVLPFRKKAAPSDYERAEYLLRTMGLWELRYQKPTELSGGECQRTAVARALINRPSLLLADEPTGALDHRNADEVSALLISMSQKEKITLITVTHSALLASRMNSAYELTDGKLNQIQ